ERGQGHNGLKRGARRESAGERQLLIHNGEDPSRVRVDDHDASVPPAEGLEGHFPDHWVLAARVVAVSRIAKGADVPRTPARHASPMAANAPRAGVSDD